MEGSRNLTMGTRARATAKTWVCVYLYVSSYSVRERGGCVG